MGVQIKTEGVQDTISFLRKKHGNIDKGISIGIENAGNHVKEELQASISGERAEPRSVDTGAFLSSITNNKISDIEARVGTHLPYPIFLEYGTVKLYERRHFRNTAARSREKVIEILKEDIEKSVQ